MNKKAKKKDIDLGGLTLEKLNTELLNSKKELFNLRCQKVMGEVTDTSRFSKVKKNVARIKTELTKRSKGEK
jgi:large subunit ribosomal protein L29